MCIRREQGEEAACPLAGGVCLRALQLQDLPDAEALTQWLVARGVEADTWGSGDSKSVQKLWKELQLSEASLEVWRSSDGKEQVVRSTHVLRGKVRSASSSDNKSFLRNTWQQFADGRVRQRNALLTEKLSVNELPLENNLHTVCARAVAEEMQQVVDESCTLGEAVAACELDRQHTAVITVLREQFREYTQEIEPSKSYPGLLTVYHLYTVDILCSGLPDVDFSTLEFTEQNAQGHRHLKYVHAWSWVHEPDDVTKDVGITQLQAPTSTAVPSATTGKDAHNIA